MPPARMRRAYCGSRITPWPSEPCRSASAIRAPTTAASASGKPSRVIAAVMKRRSCAKGTRESDIEHDGRNVHPAHHKAAAFQAATSRRRPVELAFSGHARGRLPGSASNSASTWPWARSLFSNREWACARKYAPPALTNGLARGGNSPSSEAAHRRVGGSGVRAQAHSRLLQSCSANYGVDASQLRALRCSPASVRRRTDTRAAGPAHHAGMPCVPAAVYGFTSGIPYCCPPAAGKRSGRHDPWRRARRRTSSRCRAPPSSAWPGIGPGSFRPR